MSARGARPDLRVTRGGDDRPVVITGGAGFIGTNVAHRLLMQGVPVTVLDNLSRPGVEANARWLRETHNALVRIEVGDVRDAQAVARVVASARRVIHLAAQVAVTTSIADPAHDFAVNALGTLNVLNALRILDERPPLLFTSTNKVYGSLDDIALADTGRRYEPLDETLRRCGIDETRRLDFHSPYGCSKGAADQYVLDYARTYGLPATVFRMSCVYGPHQFGTEDQGWVAHFLIRMLAGEPITLYGTGRQVRDVLHVDDLIDAMQAAFDSMNLVSGRAFNIGGGPAHTTSLVELIDAVAALTGRTPVVHHGKWRTGDQLYYVSDPERFTALTGWRPRLDLTAGLQSLHDWLQRAGAATASRPDTLRAAAAAVGE